MQFTLARLAFGVSGVFAGGLAPDLVTGPANTRPQLTQAHRVRQVGDAGLFGRQIDTGVQHPVRFLQRPLDAPYAGRAGHAFDAQTGLCCDGTVAAFFHGLEQCRNRDLFRVESDTGPFRRQIDRRLPHSVDFG